VIFESRRDYLIHARVPQAMTQAPVVTFPGKIGDDGPFGTSCLENGQEVRPVTAQGVGCDNQGANGARRRPLDPVKWSIYEIGFWEGVRETLKRCGVKTGVDNSAHGGGRFGAGLPTPTATRMDPKLVPINDK
jgi:hypothetical protein